MAAPKTEKKHHLEAFETYCILGGPYTSGILRAVSEATGVCYRSIRYWREAFNWDQRFEGRSVRVREALEEAAIQKAVSTIIKDDDDYRLLVAKTTDLYRSHLEAGNVRPTSTADLQRLIQMHRLLDDKPTGQEQVINIITAIPRPPSATPNGPPDAVPDSDEPPTHQRMLPSAEPHDDVTGVDATEPQSEN